MIIFWRDICKIIFQNFKFCLEIVNIKFFYEIKKIEDYYSQSSYEMSEKRQMRYIRNISNKNQHF